MSDEVKHSPGPWEASRWESFPPDNHWPGEIVAANGQRVFAGPFSFHALRGGSDEEAIANARLISAAPELLEACRVAVDAFRENLAEWVHKYEPLLLKAMQTCEAAIAKATGTCPQHNHPLPEGLDDLGRL